MKQNLVDITLHGQLGELFESKWELAVSSVSEALRAIDLFTDGKFFRHLRGNDDIGTKYRVLINGEDFVSEEPLDDHTQPLRVLKSNLVMNLANLKTIDVVPVVEGALLPFLLDDDSGIANIVIGALLVIGGIATTVFTGGLGAVAGVTMVMGGIGLIASGVIAMLSKPPSFEDFRTVEKGKLSYLFDGPQQVTREGGPVPLIYGRLLVGSQVIAASYKIRYIDADEATTGNPTNVEVNEIDIGKPEGSNAIGVV